MRYDGLVVDLSNFKQLTKPTWLKREASRMLPHLARERSLQDGTHLVRERSQGLCVEKQCLSSLVWEPPNTKD